jgi:hypothetical protein
MAKLDRIFASTSWISTFPLAKVSCLPKEISDHTSMLMDSGESCQMGKKMFRVEKWWLEKAEFREVASKA